MRRNLIILILSLAPGFGGSATNDELTAQRDAFREAWVEAERGDWLAVQPRLSELRGYPLLPDLHAVYLRATIKQQDDADIAEFLTANNSLWISASLRYRWIQVLADRGDWERFLEIYRAEYAQAGDRKLDCQAAEAMARTGDAEGFAKASRRLWLVGISQPKDCDPVFDRLRETGRMTDELIRERVGLALDAEQFGLATYLARQIDEEQQHRVARWQRMRSAPAAELGKPEFEVVSDDDAELVIYGLDRLARQEPDTAARLLSGFAGAAAIGPAERERLEREIALWSARDYLPTAPDRLAALPDSARDDVVCVAWARSALRAGDWSDVLLAISAMSPDEAADSSWRYWRARALAETGDRLAAAEIFTALARERGYHSFLSADRLDLPYTLGHTPAEADETVIDVLAEKSDIVRARELFAVGLDSGGRIEWQRAMASLSQSERAQASILAHRWGWHSRAIATASSSGLVNDLEIRFPAPYRDLFEDLSPRAKVPVSWAYGITRSESLFMRDVSSPAGAIGLMQLMPATGASTARELNLRYSGRASLTDPQVNIALGTTYLGKMLARFDGNQVAATAAYNAGPERVERWLPDSAAMPADVWVETIPFRETRGYVKRVLAAETVFLWRLNGRVTRLTTRMPDVRPRSQMTALAAGQRKSER
ncbi:MAG: transglycosylase SLT domain-containing protein [Gammaproteobacteria bacterium]